MWEKTFYYFSSEKISYKDMDMQVTVIRMNPFPIDNNIHSNIKINARKTVG